MGVGGWRGDAGCVLLCPVVGEFELGGAVLEAYGHAEFAALYVGLGAFDGDEQFVIDEEVVVLRDDVASGGAEVEVARGLLPGEL